MPRSKSNSSHLADKTSPRRAPVRSRRRTALADTRLECLSKAVQRRSSSSVESQRSRFSSWNRGIRRHGLSARHPQSMARFIIITQQCQYTVGAVRHILELAVNFLDISALHTRHFELAQLGQNDIPEHAGIVIRNGDTLMYFRMAFQVVMGQVRYSRSGITLLLLGQRVAATTNHLAQLHRFSTSCGSGQFRVTADGESALSPIDPVGQDERDCSARGDPDTKAAELAVIDNSVSGLGSLQIFDGSLGDYEIHPRPLCPHHVHKRWRLTVVQCLTVSEVRQRMTA